MNNYNIYKVNSNDIKTIKRISNIFKNIDKEFVASSDLYTEHNYFGEWNSPASNRIYNYWTAINNDELLGAGILKYKNTSENPNSARVDIRVKKEHRKIGIGKKLLKELIEYSAKYNRSKLTIKSNILSNSDFFLKQIGAEIKDFTIEKYLELENLVFNHNLKSIEGYNIKFWQNEASENDMRDLVIAKDFLNDMPVGSRQKELWSFSKEWLKQEEITRKLLTNCWWTLLVYNNSVVVGYCDIEFYNDSQVACQVDTAIHPEHRNKGIATWIKKYLISKVLLEKKDVKYIKTSNSYSNHAIININSKFGFSENTRYLKWIVDVETIKKKL